MLSVRFEVGVSLLLAPPGDDKRSPKALFPLLENANLVPRVWENAGIQWMIRKRVPAGAPAGAGSY